MLATGKKLCVAAEVTLSYGIDSMDLCLSDLSHGIGGSDGGSADYDLLLLL